MAIEQNEVEHLANLARVAVSEREREGLRNDLEEILMFVSQVKEISSLDTTGQAGVATPEAGEHRNILRNDDAPHEAGIFTEGLLAAAPARKGSRISVKKIL